MKRLNLIVAGMLATGILATGTHGQDDDFEGKTDSDWLEFYYLKPTPDRTVSEVKNWSEDGLLKNEDVQPAIIGFLSQVLRQNRGRIAGWYDDLAGLPQEEKKVLHTAMILSRTSEADDVLRKAIGREYDQQKEEFPKILEMKLPQPKTLDTIWGYFYATGSETAIRRIIFAFQFADAPSSPDFAKVPKNYKPFYTDLPESAAWMLRSNGRRHPKVVEICEKFLETEDELNATEKRLLREVLSDLRPQKYPRIRPVEDEGDE